MPELFNIRIAPSGKWHRRQYGNGQDHTACGLPIGAVFASRDHELDENLCSECFTLNERDIGAHKKLERDNDGFSDPFEDSIKPFEGYENDDPTDLTSDFDLDDKFDDSDDK